MLHVAEEMTSLSKIFRSQSINESDKRQISIRNFNPVTETDVKRELTLPEVLAERTRLMDEAHKMIAVEKGVLENLRQTASEDIASMRKAWEEEKVQLQQQAYDEGFQIGHEEGRNKALSDMANAVQLANDTTEQSYANAIRYQASQERVILELAMRSAERIIGGVIAEDEEKFLSVIQRALKEAREMKEIKIYVSAEHFKLVSNNQSELASIFPPDVPFLLFVNEDFESNECYIETNHGRIVVSVDEQLNELREQLIEIMESGD